MMRHFGELSADERARLFLHDPQPFGPDSDVQQLGTALGATLYVPASRPRFARDVVRRAAEGVTSVVVCLEDAVGDGELADAERNAVAELRTLATGAASLPLLFARVRRPEQIDLLVGGLGEHAAVLTGIVVPKFGEDTGGDYFEAVLAASASCGHRLLVMPVLESSELGHAETRIEALLGARRAVDKYRELVPAVRVGATDLSAAFGLRRPPEFTVWDVRVVADALAAVVNVFGRVGSGAVTIAGPVWEYFPSRERIFRPQLRLTPFAAGDERALRAELLAADLDGLIREVALDRTNGFTGKTVIHPSHVAPVHAMSVVSHEEYCDAQDVLAGPGGGVSASQYGNKMNESKPHTAWAQRTLARAEAFGVAREGVSFVDLLGAVSHP